MEVELELLAAVTVVAAVEESGIYRLSADFLNQIGLNTGNINPRKFSGK